MADNRVQVEIVAENRDLRAKLAEAEAQIAAFGKSGGAKAAAGLDVATRAASLLSKTLRLIALPVTVVSAAVKLAGYIADADERAKAFGKTLDEIGNRFSEGVAQSAFKLRLGPVEVDEDAALKAMRDALKAIDDASDKVLKNDSNTAAATLLPKAVADWLGVKGTEEVVRLAEAQKDRIRQAIRDQTSALAEAQRRRAEDLAQQDLQARIAAAKGTERAALEAEMTERKRSESIRRARGRDAVALKAIAEDQAKAERQAQEDAREKSRQGVRSEIAGSLKELANTDAAKQEIDHQEKLAEIRRRYRQAQSEEEKGLLQELFDFEMKLDEKKKALQKEARERQIREMIDEQKKAQSDGFTIKDINTNGVGSGSALQIIGQQLPSLITLAGGGR